MNKLKLLLQLFKKSDKYNKEKFDSDKIDEYTKEAYNVLKKLMGDKAPSYDEVRDSMIQVGKNINKK